jgi:hypothetical protein
MDTDHTADLLAGTEMFGKLDDESRRRLAERAVRRRLVKGQSAHPYLAPRNRFERFRGGILSARYVELVTFLRRQVTRYA